MDRIKSGADISLLFKEGKRYSSSSVTILVKKSDAQHDPSGRVAFIAGKKLGNAVWRNKAKRRLRALCRDAGGPWMGLDVVFIAKPSTTTASYSKVLRACNELMNSVLKDQ